MCVAGHAGISPLINFKTSEFDVPISEVSIGPKTPTGFITVKSNLLSISKVSKYSHAAFSARVLLFA